MRHSANSESEPPGPPGELRPAPWLAYTLAVVLTGGTLALRLGMAGWFEERPVLVLFTLPILLSAYVGGLGPGLVATTVAGIGVNYFLIPPVHSLALAPTIDTVQWLILVATGVITSILAGDLRRTSRSLRENKELFSKAFRLSPDCLAVIRLRDRTLVRANEALCRLWNRELDDIIGQPVQAFSAWTSEAARLAFMHQLQSAGECANLETTQQLSDGRVLPVEMSARLISLAGETCALCVMRDLTERRSAESAARSIAAIVDASDDAIIGKDLRGLVTSWNSGAEKIFGLTAAEMVGASILRIIPADRHSEETGILERIARGESVRHFETVRVHSDGRPLAISVTVSPIRDAAGRVIGASKIARDISERKRAEEALRASRATLDAALASMTDAVFISDATGRFVEFNEAFATFHKFGSKQECAKTLAEYPAFLEVFMADGTPAPLEQWAVPRALRGETMTNAEYSLRRKDTGESWVGSYSFSPIRDRAGVIVGSVCAGRDITTQKKAEAMLRESEERMRSLVTMMPDAMFINLDQRVVFINPRALHLWRAERADQILGRSPFELFHPACHELIRQRIGRVLTAGLAAPVEELKIIALDGTSVPVETTAVAFPYGGKQAIQVIVRDISERKRAEAALMESENEFRGMFNQAAVGMAQVGLDGRWLRANERLCQIVDYPWEELRQKTFQDITHPEDLDADLAYVRQLLEGRLQTYTMEKRYLRKDQSVVPANLTVALVRGTSGAPKYFVAVVEDISERKRTEEAARQSDQRYHSLFDSLIEGFCTIEMVFAADGRAVDYRFLEINPAFEKQTGLHHTQGRLMRDLAPNHEAHWFEIYGKIARTGEPAHFENEAKELGRHYDVSAYRVGGAESRKVAILFNDITTRKRAEAKIHQLNAELEQRVIDRTAQLEAANKELEAFSYSVSHDLRTPLRAMDGFSQAVLEDFGPDLPPDGLRYLQTIRDSAQRMGELIDDLLAFSQLYRHPLRRQNVDTGKLVQSVLADLQADWAGRTVTFEIGELPSSDGDPALLKQVWVNLLANAVKYTGRQAKAVIAVGALAAGAEQVFFVRDNGCGFEMQYAHKLFGVFQRLHRAEDYNGTGVGLAIVKRIVARHGGRVWAEGALGQGASFYFTLKAGVAAT